MKKSAFLSTGILGILALLIVFAALAMTGVFDAEQPKLLFSSADAEKFYDGTELQNDGWELIDGELKKGHTVEATVFGTQTDAGEAENLMSVIIRNKKGKDVTKLYEIEYQYGLLKVNPAQVTIQAESSAKQYDGTELVCETYKIVSGMMYLNHMLQVENVGERTEVGESLNVPFAKVIDEDGNDVSGNYQFAYVDGSLVVTPHAITVQSAGNQKTYDGTPLTAELAEITAGELLEGHTIEYTYTGSQTTAGKGSNTFGVAIKDANGVNVTHNYTVTTVFGELEVFKRPITVATSDESKVYDGTPLTNTELNLLIGELVAGHTFVPAATGSQTEVGVSENEFDVEIVDQEGNVLSENYEIEKVFGTLEVMARDIVFRSETLEKIYDTEELSSDDIEIALGSLAPGQIAEFDVTGKITDAGSVLNKFTVVIKDSEGNTTTSNYNLQSEFGTLTVLPISITVGSETATKVYDGTELTNDAASIFEGEIFPTHSIELFVTGKQIDAGSSKNTVLAVVYDENGIDVTRNYDITYSYGTLTILKAPITVTSADLFVVYDGKEHKNEASEITAGALVPGQTLEVRFTSKYTDAGAYNNVFAVDIFNEEGERVTYNYDVTRVYGSFVISKRQITIATASDSKVYDGLVLEKHELLNEDEIDLVEGQKLLLSFTSSVINVG
ncbi:MAG: hypothetical protein IJC80_05560, partial [Clostridia bacterium]|nr:hypothetical protein [Clostridia bacterium]